MYSIKIRSRGGFSGTVFATRDPQEARTIFYRLTDNRSPRGFARGFELWSGATLVSSFLTGSDYS